MIWLRTSQASALLVLLELICVFLAFNSYGTQSNVLNSWSGYPSLAYAAAAAGAGTITAGTLTTGWTAATSDFKYLMWKTPAAVVPNATDYTLIGNMWNLAYDANYSSAFYLALIGGVLEIAVAVLGWGPFAKFYQDEADQLAAPVYDVNGCDAYGNDVYGNPCNGAADASSYDAYGCNSSGLDVYGNECPAPAY